MVSFSERSNRSFWLSIVFYLCILQSSFCRTFNETSKLLSNLKVPAIFAFGDSLVDTGNNNNLPMSLIKSNFPPYGRSFQDCQATGRFSDGRLTIDFLAEALGLKKNVQAYLDPKLREQDLQTGVSFGSAGTGYDHMTSRNTLVRSMNEQLRMLKGYRKTLRSLMGRDRANFLLRDSIFIVAAGSSDLAITYFGLPYRRLKYNPKAYTSLMIRRATRFIQKLYKIGARKIGVVSIPPLGLTPMARTLSGGVTRKIPEYYNDAVKIFNAKLNLEVKFLNSKLPNATFVYIDVYNIMIDIIQNRTQYGFTVAKRGCCGAGLIEVGPLCNPFSLFSNVKKFIFWDSYHPTEAVYNITATQIFDKYFPSFL